MGISVLKPEYFEVGNNLTLQYLLLMLYVDFGLSHESIEKMIQRQRNVNSYIL
jgi:hypothetical protein